MGTGRTDEFRKDAVRIALTSGLTRRQVADDLGVGLSTLNKWVTAHRDTDVVSPEDRELGLSNLSSGNSAASGSRILAFPFDVGLGVGGPFLVDLHQHGANQPQEGVFAGKDPDLDGAPFQLLLHGPLDRV